MTTQKKREVLTAGSLIEIIGGELRGQRVIVAYVLGNPHEKRLVGLRISENSEIKEIPQHHLKVLRSPEGWLPTMKPKYLEYALIKKDTEPKKQEVPTKKKAQSQKKKNKKPRKSYVNGLEIPQPPRRYANRRRSK